MTKFLVFYATVRVSVPSLPTAFESFPQSATIISKYSNQSLTYLALLKRLGRVSLCVSLDSPESESESLGVKVQVTRPHDKLTNLQFLAVWPGIFEKHPD